jgi:hypothetical protein
MLCLNCYRPSNEVDQYRSSKEITIKGVDVPNPIQAFDESNLPDDMMEALK